MSKKITTDICQNFCDSIIDVLNLKLPHYNKDDIKKQLDILLKGTKWTTDGIMNDLKPIIDEMDKESKMDKNALSKGLKKAANHKWIPGHPFFQAGTKKIFNECAKKVDKKIKEEQN